MKDEEVLKGAKERYKLGSEAWNDNAEAAFEDVDFALLSNQWPEDVAADRERERRPMLTINKLPSFIRQVVNDARQNKPAIKVHPVDSGADRMVAEIYNGLIRNIEQTSNADVAYDTSLEQSASGGFGFFRVSLDYAYDDSFDLDIKIERIANQFSVIPDHNSTTADSSDWEYCFVLESLPKDEFKEKYKSKDEVSWEEYEGLGAPWYTDDERITVAEYWTKTEEPREIVKLSDGRIIPADQYEIEKEILFAQGIQEIDRRTSMTCKITQHIMSGAEILETTEWKGKYIPIIPVYGSEINEKGKRHFKSLIRDAVDAQRMFNYWRTTATELVALAPKAPWVGPKGAFKTDADKWDTANTESHSYLEYDGPIPPQRQPFAGVPAGALQEALNASDDMKAIIGIYDASLGSRSNETSGRAIMARQREGDVSTFHFIDNQARAIRHCGRILLDLIPKVYTGDRILRVIGEDGEQNQVRLGAQYMRDDGTLTMLDLGAGKYDLTVSVGPSFTSRREEAAYQMTEFVRAYPPAAPVLGDLLAKNMDWPQADEVERRLKSLLPPQAGNQLPPQVQQAMQKMQEELQKLQQENQSLKTDKSIDAAKVKVDAFNAETDRMEVMNNTQLPPQQWVY